MPTRHRFSTVYPLLRQTEDAVGYLSLKHRSMLIKCCQAQHLPRSNQQSTLKGLIETLPPVASTFLQPCLEYFEQFRQLIEHPLHSAILLDICRGHPLPTPEIERAKADSWYKEIHLCESVKRPPKCNWRVAFDPGQSGEHFLPDVPPNPMINKYIYLQLRRWREKLRGRRLYPRMTHKQMSWATRDAYEQESGQSLEDVPIFGQDNWSRFYMERGIECKGCSEMRQTWTPSQAKPRTYFAQGGDHYGPSRHVQDPLSDLHDALISTHRVFRLLPSRLSLMDGEHFRVYDLTSFTSNFAEQYYFVHELARFCGGVKVYLMDECAGPVERDLGEVLHTYNETCNAYPELTYHRYTKSEQTACHGMASMLGIFGNLMTCTVAHGIAILQLFDDESSSNVAGDDGIYLETPDNQFTAHDIITTLGAYEPSKTFLSDEPGAICLKRPIKHSALRLELGLSFIPPTGALVRELATDYRDPRYRFLGIDDLTWNQKISIAGRDLLRFIRSCWRGREKLDIYDVEMIFSIYEQIRKMFRCVGPSVDPYFFPVCPTIGLFEGDTDPLHVTLFLSYKNIARIPKQGQKEDVALDEVPIGGSFVDIGCKHWKWLKQLGLLTSEPLFDYIYGAEGYHRLVEMYESDLDDKMSSPMYEYTVVDTIPRALYAQ